MKYLFFDTETTGIEDDARIVQLAAVVCNEQGETLETYNAIVCPEGFLIPARAAGIHGITTEIAKREGLLLSDVLDAFLKLSVNVDVLVAHNMNFDFAKVVHELRRKQRYQQIEAFSKIPKFCTMQSTIDFVAVGWNSYYQSYKWPKLQELHFKLFNCHFKGEHDALADVNATVKCFFELHKRQVL